MFKSSQEDEELCFSHSEFLTEIDATELNHQKSEPNFIPKSSSGDEPLTKEQLA